MIKQKTPRSEEFLCCFDFALLCGELLHGSVQAGFAPGGVVFLDDILFSGFIECFLGLLKPFLGTSNVGLGDRLTCSFYSALDNAFDGAVTEGVLRGDTHVLLGRILDRHIVRFKS